MKRLMFAAAFGAAASLGATVYLAPGPSAHAQSESDTYRSLTLFGDILERVDGAYVEDVDNEKLIEAAIHGMFSALDPHSGYLPPEAHEDMQEQTQGQFGGLGIEVTMENGVVKVVAPMDDTPAAAAGLQANDYITHLDGEPVLGMQLTDAVKLMRGPVKTEIVLMVEREGVDEPFEVTIVRDIITVYPVKARREGDVAYLRITTFNKQTSENLHEHINDLREEIGGDLRGYVLDLRNNPGGLLVEAIAVSDTFLDEGEIVSTRGRDPRDAERHNATTGDLTEGAPVVVLINGGSASASEIVAGALQDNRRAILVGTRSFGKGSVQTIMPLNNNGALRLTTARYYTPDGDSIQARGIDPDFVIEQLKVDDDAENGDEAASGSQRNEDSLRGRLENDTEAAPSERDANAEFNARRDELKRTDFQLAYALDLLYGVSRLSHLRE